MRKFDDIQILACPVCKALVFSKNIQSHFENAHNLILYYDRHREILDDAKKNPVGAKRVAAFLKRVEKLPKIERTPRSMRQYDGMRTGPLGPGKG